MRSSATKIFTLYCLLFSIFIIIGSTTSSKESSQGLLVAIIFLPVTLTLIYSTFNAFKNKDYDLFTGKKLNLAVAIVIFIILATIAITNTLTSRSTSQPTNSTPIITNQK